MKSSETQCVFKKGKKKNALSGRFCIAIELREKEGAEWMDWDIGVQQSMTPLTLRG